MSKGTGQQQQLFVQHQARLATSSNGSLKDFAVPEPNQAAVSKPSVASWVFVYCVGAQAGRDLIHQVPALATGTCRTHMSWLLKSSPTLPGDLNPKPCLLAPEELTHLDWRWEGVVAEHPLAAQPVRGPRSRRPWVRSKRGNFGREVKRKSL